ncbi:DUF5776 domain-containing protein, partial [Apilactobacillus xinyiensis]|uniref:DUF5776 domain-containing protein n=1 Tax=Apilactobacillus xinyiensis TaxID=2841032 RepID=UPI00201023C5
YNDGTPVSDAYNQAKANFDAGVNGKDKLVNGSSADTKGAAYQVGKAAYDGINDDINGNGDKSANYTDANQKAAYQNAQKAYNAGLAGNTTTDDAKLNKTANVAGIGAKAGMEDAIKGETHEPTDANQKAAYDNAQKAYQAGFNGDIDSTVAKSNAMANKLGSSAKSGADAFMNGSTTNPGDANGDNNAKAIYNGYQAAQDGYNKALNNQPKPNNSPASVAGFNFGQSIVAGINDFAAGKSAANPSDVNYMKGYNSAQSGYKAGAQDATNNKPNATQNGSLNIPSSSDKASYISSYNGAYNGYKDGLNGKQANTASETVPYQQAYANGVKQGQSDAAAALAASMNNNVAQPVDETAKVTKDFMDGNLDKLAGEGYGDLYKQMQAGFETAMKHGTKNLNASDVYSSGYKMAQDGLAGMQAAKSGKTVDLKDASQAFVSGMNGYKAGLKAAIKGNSNSDIVYKSTYKNGYKDGMKKAIKIATNTAKKQAKSSKKMPNLKEYSKEYAKAYTKAFKEERLNETYYTKASKGSHFKVTSKHGIYAHSSDKFTNANKTRKLPNNETFSVKKVVKVNGVTRFYINSNEYVTSNKDLVKLSK